MRRVLAACAAAVALAACGCSTEGAVGDVAGKVTIDGKPAEGVALTFQGADGRVATASTDDQGDYTAVNVPVGTLTVTAAVLGGEGDSEGMIQKNAGADPSRPAAAPPKKKGPKLPERYADPTTSGLTHTATAGESRYDIPLSGK